MSNNLRSASNSVLLDIDTIPYLIEFIILPYLSYLSQILIYCFAAPKTAIAIIRQPVKSLLYNDCSHYVSTIEFCDTISSSSKIVDLSISLCMPLIFIESNNRNHAIAHHAKTTESLKYLSILDYRISRSHSLSRLSRLSRLALSRHR